MSKISFASKRRRLPKGAVMNDGGGGVIISVEEAKEAEENAAKIEKMINNICHLLKLPFSTKRVVESFINNYTNEDRDRIYIDDKYLFPLINCMLDNQITPLTIDQKISIFEL